MGAKFSSGGGATVFYDDGPITAPSGEQGTQRTEFEAAIKSVTSSTTVGAVFIYDTRNDSDGGAWRKKARGSWYYETLNTATRGGRREFPSVALIVADNVSATSTLSIYDLDDPSMPLWMQFTQGGSFPDQYILGRSTPNITSVTALNGRVYVGMDNSGYGEALVEIDFANDGAKMFSTTSWKQNNSIAERNTAVTNTQAVGGDIVNNAVNDVAATVLEGAELGALGLPIPTISVATAGGISVIHGGSGTVYDKATTSAAATLVEFDKNGNLYAGQGSYVTRFDLSTLYSDVSNGYLSQYENNGTIVTIREFANGGIPGLVGLTDSLAITDNGFAGGSSSGLTQVKFNDGDHEDSAVAFVTSTYNSGMMLGDIRFAGLANSRTEDRSVKGNDLTLNGSVTQTTAVGTFGQADATDLFAYSGFSASNYLSRANDTDFDFTGDFSVTLWFKDATTSDPFVTRLENSTSAGKGFVISTTSGGLVSFAIYTTGFQSSGRTQVISGSAFTGSLGWKQLVATRRSGRMHLYIDGVSQGTPQSQSTDLTDSDAPLGIGIDYSLGTGFGGSLALVRISATAPTPTQVADIYRQEAPLFRSGAKCLLQSDGGSPNLVNDLSYDSTTGLLHAYQGGTNTAETRFKGLEAVDSYGAKADGWSASGATGGVATGGVKVTYRAAATGGVIVDIPPVDLRGDINIADTKLPDDGKIRFTGVTTDATPTVIGQIPVAENEALNVIVRIEGSRYDLRSSSWNLFGEIKQQFYRNLGEDVAARSEASKLINEGTAATDFDLDISTSSQTVQIKVTGSSSLRMQWNAEVEVQRISEKTYER